MKPEWSSISKCVFRLGMGCLTLLSWGTSVCGQESGTLPPPLGILRPGPTNAGPYAPQPILPGGIVSPLYPAGSPALNSARVHEAEFYNYSSSIPGRITWITNIHNPSVEIHTVESGLNTGATVILVAGGGHRTLNVGTEGADFVHYFRNFGVNTVLLRNRLRGDGYDVKKDAVQDAFQAIRLVRSLAPALRLDAHKIGIMGFSAGAELATATAVYFNANDREMRDKRDPLAAHTGRPDFVGVVYPGPTPFARGAKPELPRNAPPAFVVTGGSGDRGHALWATDYVTALLEAGIPNVEMHLYGNGRHPGDPLPDGSRMSGGLTYRNGIPFGTWQDRFVDWFKDLGFLGKPGVETKAAADIAAFLETPPPKPAK